MASFAVNPQKVTEDQTNYIYPMDCSVSGLKPNSTYDFYVDGKKRNDVVVQGFGKVYSGSGSVNGLKSDASGKCNFTFFPILLKLNSNTGILGGIGSSIAWSAPLPKKIELIGPDSNSAAVAKPPVVNPSNPVVYASKPPTLPADKVTEKIISNTTIEVGRTNFEKTTVEYGTGNQTPLSEVSLYFDYIQSFYIDPSSVGGSQTVSVSDIELFFKQKPNAINNQSQILDPGVYLYICQMKDGQPDLSKVYAESKVRLDYDEIFPSLDAKSETIFAFKSPLLLKTGESYGIVINFEDPQFSLWTATQGKKSIDTGRVCGSAYTSGKLFRASNYLEIDKDPKTFDQLFKALSDTDLKFYVNVLEFDTTTRTVELVNQDYEFLTFTNLVANTSVIPSFLVGENVYQDFGNTSANVSFYKSGTLRINAGVPGTIHRRDSVQYNVYGTGTKFFTDVDYNDTIVITDGTLGNTDVRKVSKIISDTQIQLNKPTSFTNSAARYKVTAVGKLENLLLNPNTAILNNSNASDVTRFIKDGVNYITFTGGTGYANSDYIRFTGGTVEGRANLVTNSSGGIISINITNTGYGFTSTPTATVYTSTGVPSSTSAVFTISTGAQLKGEMSLVKAEISNVTTFSVDSVIPDIQVQVKGASYRNPQINFSVLNSLSNSYTVSSSNYIPVINDSIDVKNYDATILSKSLEIANKSTLITSISEGKSSILKFDITTSNKYESPELHTSLASIYTFTNSINNDATNEHTNSGNATSRHISKKITFAKNRFAEDVRLITNVWRPSGTDVKFYARIHNSKDEDAFDDKDWTELELKDATYGGRTYSSLSDDKDYVELTYGFRSYPEIGTTATGIATLANAGITNTTITGVGTSFDTQIANGDVIVLYDPLFANTTYAVAVVANTPTASAFEINTAIANASLAAASLKIGVASRKNSAFNNIQNENVVRYYSTSLTEYDTYDTLAIKIVPLSSTSYIVPRVNDVRVIGVSA